MQSLSSLNHSNAFATLQGVECLDDTRLRAFISTKGTTSVSLGPDLPTASSAQDVAHDNQTALVLARRRHPHKPFSLHVRTSAPH